MSQQAELWTIGHSNHGINVFVNMLKMHGISKVYDVRTSPYSKYNPQYNRAPLEAALKANGLEYRAVGKFLGGKAEVSIHDSEYNDRLYRIIEQLGEHKIALMCSEKDPNKCHRAYKLGACLLRSGIQVNHIVPGDVWDQEDLEKQHQSNWLAQGLYMYEGEET